MSDTITAALLLIAYLAGVVSGACLLATILVVDTIRRRSSSTPER